MAKEKKTTIRKSTAKVLENCIKELNSLTKKQRLGVLEALNIFYKS